MLKLVSRFGRWMRNYLREARVHPGNISPSNSRSGQTATRVTQNLECPICLQPVDVSVASYCSNTPCNAHYHRQCIEQWKEHNQGNLTCTLCTLRTICLKPKKNRRTKRNRRGSNARTIMIQPAENAPARRQDPPARRPVQSAPARRQDPPARRPDAPVRRPDAPVRRPVQSAPARRQDPPARRPVQSAPARRQDHLARRPGRTNRQVDIPPLRRDRPHHNHSRHSITGDRVLIRRNATSRDQRSMIDRVLNNSPLNDHAYNRQIHDSITMNRHRYREQIISPRDDLPYIYHLNNRANRERDLARHRIRHRYQLNTSQTTPYLV